MYASEIIMNYLNQFYFILQKGVAFEWSVDDVFFALSLNLIVFFTDFLFV
jgi:hypothetical protein